MRALEQADAALGEPPLDVEPTERVGDLGVVRRERVGPLRLRERRLRLAAPGEQQRQVVARGSGPRVELGGAPVGGHRAVGIPLRGQQRADEKLRVRVARARREQTLRVLARAGGVAVRGAVARAQLERSELAGSQLERAIDLARPRLGFAAREAQRGERGVMTRHAGRELDGSLEPRHARVEIAARGGEQPLFRLELGILAEPARGFVELALRLRRACCSARNTSASRARAARVVAEARAVLHARAARRAQPAPARTSAAIAVAWAVRSPGERCASSSARRATAARSPRASAMRSSATSEAVAPGSRCRASP